MTTSAQRLKLLKKALLRVKHGKTENIPLGTKLSITAVANEAGVTPALLHNNYKTFVDEIRLLTKKSDKTKEEKIDQKLADLTEKNKSLEEQLKQEREQNQKLRSRNFELYTEVLIYREKYPGENITPNSDFEARRKRRMRRSPRDKD